MLDPAAPTEYLIGHLEDALARDPRVTEQGLHVALHTDPLVVVVSGAVIDARHQSGLADVIAEMLPSAELRDETTVVRAAEATGAAEEVS